ncbi:MAG: hypothetical protein ACE5KM_01500 [Planctomycetaceae bacterium]
MIPRNGLLSLAAVACCVGCDRENTGSYREYATDAVKVKSSRAPQNEDKSPSGRVLKPVRAPIPSEARDDLADALPAAIGFASRPITSGAFPRSGKQIMTPAVGPGAMLALIRQTTAPSREQGPAIPTPNGAKPSASGRVPRVLIARKTFQVEGPEGAVRVTYDDIDLLKVLNMDPVTPAAPKMMPAWLKNLSGKKVRIRGFMSPAFQQTGITNFLMGRDNKACCFPGRAKVYDLFPVKLRKGVTTNYIQNRPFDVVGTFYVKPWIEDGRVYQVYQLEDAVVVQ